jgi:hypothetical protein
MAYKQSPRFYLLTPPDTPPVKPLGIAATSGPSSHPYRYIDSLIAAMESVNIPSENVPAELKSCDQILKRAKELKKAEPVVAYWCKLIATGNIPVELRNRLLLRCSKGIESAKQVSRGDVIPHDPP